ncbi:hypothetical protein HPP92_024820 [Vanilla planifolia]|uniref:Uncharacterized protein n=1 Tax=Vanilla planifolia TaxID=51239 RepID=A0A835UBV9_VANPL|nr:hypothetical protein HPP92_024820 [Vanilla planifolia]
MRNENYHPITSKSKYDALGEPSNISGRTPLNKSQAPSQSSTVNNADGQKAFYQNQDPGTYTQLVLETATIEILSLPATASQIVSSLVQIVVHVQPSLIQSSNGMQEYSGSTGQASGILYLHQV